MASRTASIDAGAGTTAVSVSTIVTGLKPDTQYNFRLDATSSLGTVHGVTETFSTAETSCASDKATIAADEQTIARQNLTVEEQSQSVASTEAGDVTSPATIVQDEATVEADEYTVSTDEQALSATTLTSPIAGTVTALNGSVGETVSGSSSNSNSSSSSSSGTSGATGSSSSSSSSGSSFVTITNLGNLEVVASFAEADISNIAIGDPATVSLAALPDTDLSALVTAVSPTSTVSNNVVTYDVTIAIDDPPSDVKVGMTADVTVITASKTGVLIVPSAAVTTTGTRSTVTVLSHGIQTTQPVVTGLVGSSTTQIVAGLKAGEVVVEPTVSVSSTGTSTSGGTTFTGGGGGGLSLGGFGG
jgi:multidrug efflux pump subunit AcrA (membrane-fusion protein)